ncbi:MAG: ABC transporter ATP-binding protein, partial [Planctomycetaceae bacterium]
MIQVKNYCKTYAEVQAVNNLSFTVEPGQVLGLVGPNGAGKTTTIRAITGIIPPTNGTLTIAEHDVVADPTSAKAKLAYIPDDPKLFDLLTVTEHLHFTAEIYDVPKADRPAIFERLLQQFALTEKRDTSAGELSRGMRQKVAICCAYLHNPRAIL